jgi:hypothetical protein
MPSADSRPTVRMDRSILSHDAVTCGGSPEVSSTAFCAQPPDLPPVPLMDIGFAITCSLARHRRPHHPVLVHRLAPLIHASFRPRLATTPLRFSSPSPPPGWTGDFHPQAVEHVRHTRKRPDGFPSGPKSFLTLKIRSQDAGQAGPRGDRLNHPMWQSTFRSWSRPRYLQAYRSSGG